MALEEIKIILQSIGDQLAGVIFVVILDYVLKRPQNKFWPIANEKR
jgi:hypothetical protein